MRLPTRHEIYPVLVLLCLFQLFSAEPPSISYLALPVSIAPGLYEILKSLADIIVAQHLHRSPVAPSQLNPKIPSHIERAILKCLEKDPDRRYQAVSEVRRALIRGAYGRVREEHPVTGDIILTGEGDTEYELVIQRRQKFADWDDHTALKFRDDFYQMKNSAMITSPSHPFHYTFVRWPDVMVFRKVIEYDERPDGRLDRLRKFLR